MARVQATIKNGIRASASRGYLHPIKNKKNFSLKKLSMVKRILINPKTKRAYGVEFVNSGFTYQVKARKEVILSAGAVNSPQILMLSGIGPKDHLEEKEIEVIHDLPGVGENSMDHIFGNPVVYTAENVGGFKINLGSLLEYANNFTGTFASTETFETIAYVNVDDVKNKSAQPDIELIFFGTMLAQVPSYYQSLGASKEVIEEMYGDVLKNESFSIFPLLLRPKSRGKILLEDNKHDTPPIIASNLLNSTEDLDVIVKGTRIAMEIVAKAAFQTLKPKIWKKPLKACEEFDFNSDESIKCLARNLGVALFHLVGTCKMGPDADPLSVVDNKLRVKGINGLRVIDASIMPHIPSAHTNAATLMIGEKGADLIKGDYS